MFQLNKFTYKEFLCLFWAKNNNGKSIFYVVDERRWHNAVVYAIEIHRKTPRFIKGVYSFPSEEKALEKANLLILEKQAA